MIFKNCFHSSHQKRTNCVQNRAKPTAGTSPLYVYANSKLYKNVLPKWDNSRTCVGEKLSFRQSQYNKKNEKKKQKQQQQEHE